MEKEFASYEEALALKKLGFAEDCFGYYYEGNLVSAILFHNNKKDGEKVVRAPLYQQAFRWFREKHDIFVSPTESTGEDARKYDWIITKTLGDGKLIIKFVGYKDTYEEAESACLKKIIELCKKN